MPSLTVLTINCLGLPLPIPGLRRRLLALGKAIQASEADVACLQEVGRWRYLPWLRGDEHRWPHVIARTHPYAPRGGLATLARLPIDRTLYHTYEARGTVASLTTTELHQRKGTLCTYLTISDTPVAIFNTHLAANYNARWSYTNPYAKVERAQLRELAAWVRAVPEDTLVIVAGDYNVPRGSWLYDEFRAATGVIDPLALSHEPTYRPLPGVSERAAQALDHVLVRVPTGLAVTLDAELCFRNPVLLEHGRIGYLSDHLGVKVSLRWERMERGATPSRA